VTYTAIMLLLNFGLPGVGSLIIGIIGAVVGYLLAELDVVDMIFEEIGAFIETFINLVLSIGGSSSSSYSASPLPGMDVRESPFEQGISDSFLGGGTTDPAYTMTSPSTTDKIANFVGFVSIISTSFLYSQIQAAFRDNWDKANLACAVICMALVVIMALVDYEWEWILGAVGICFGITGIIASIATSGSVGTHGIAAALSFIFSFIGTNIFLLNALGLS